MIKPPAVKTPIWITKYAFTRGIIATQAVIKDEGYASIDREDWLKDAYSGAFLHPRAYTLSAEDAFKRVEEDRERKLECARKSMARLAKKSVKIVPAKAPKA